jgi:hypothetical protein
MHSLPSKTFVHIESNVFSLLKWIQRKGNWNISNSDGLLVYSALMDDPFPCQIHNHHTTWGLFLFCRYHQSEV